MINRVKANYITIFNAIIGFLAILFFIRELYLYGVLLILFGGFLDWLDGTVARKKNEESSLGQELDSLADMVTFGVAPAVFGFMLFDNSYIVIVSAIFFYACGMYRLARFNVSKVLHFEGLPITSNAIIFPALYFTNANEAVFSLFFVVIGILMVSKFKVKKWV